MSSGGSASATIVNGGAETVSSGGTSTAPSVLEGSLYVSAGGVVASAFISAGTTEIVFSGGAANGGYVGGLQTVQAGGTVSGIGVDGVQDVAGGTAIDTRVTGGQQVRADGTAIATTVSSGGTAFVYGGGTEVNLTVARGTASAGDGAAFTGTLALTDDGGLVTTETGRLPIAAVITGAGGVTQDGSGTVVLGSTGVANFYTGGTLIRAGTVELANQTAAGSGAVVFAPGAATGSTLRLDSLSLPTNPIFGFVAGDAIDLPALAYDAANTVSATGDTVSIATPSQTYHLTVAGAGSEGGFVLSPANGGGTRLTTKGTAPGTGETSGPADLNSEFLRLMSTLGTLKDFAGFLPHTLSSAVNGTPFGSAFQNLGSMMHAGLPPAQSNPHVRWLLSHLGG